MRKISFILIFFLCFLEFILNQDAKNIFDVYKNLNFCGVGLNKYEIKISPVISQKNKSNPNRKLSTVFSPIRILLDTTYFDIQGSQLISIKDKVPMLKEAMNKAVKALSDILEVENYGNDIFYDILNQNFFYYYKIYNWNPIFNNNNNIPADLIIIAKFEEEGEFPQGVLASAMPLILYQSTNRPIVGLLTVSRSESFYSYTHIKEYFSTVFLHELTHALGFLESMFPYFPQGIDKLLKKMEIRGKQRTLIISSKVIGKAKQFFNCNSLVGLELEDQGGPGSSISHWEQRILLGDYMGAVIYQEEMAISEFTLALLEDSGWYRPKYYTGGLFRFGKNQGCEFIDNECLDNNLKTQFKNEFFDYSNAWTGSCSTGRQSRTYATISNYNYKSIDPLYYRIKVSNDFAPGGSIYTADFCPTNGQRYDEVGYNYFYGSCKYGSTNFGSYVFYINPETGFYENGHPNSALPNLGEKISDQSFCIMTNIVPKGQYKIYNSVFHPMCYPTYCSSKSLTIQINELYVVCPREGGNIKVEGYDGYISCPDYNLICTGTVLCNDIFDCINKKSLPKNETYDYNSLTTLQQDELVNDKEEKIGNELGDDGPCPFNSSYCIIEEKKLKNKSFYINNNIKIWLILIEIYLLFL